MTASINVGAMAVNLAGGLALFLYGMHRMTEALRILAGATNGADAPGSAADKKSA